MGKTLEKAARDEREIHVAMVTRHGEEIIIPEGMSLQEAMNVIYQTQQREETATDLSAVFPCDPHEAAYAINRAIEKVCGVLLTRERRSIFEDEPNEVSIEVEPGKYLKFMMGKFKFPMDTKGGWLETTWQRTITGEFHGMLKAHLRQKYSDIFSKIVETANYYIAHESIYRGRTLAVQFTDPDGDALGIPVVHAWDVRNASTAKLVFNRDLEDSIDLNILTPIRDREEVARAGTPFKRGILLAGDYGVGKTELAAAIAAEGSNNGMTVVYIRNVAELPYAIRFAMRLGPAIVFAEDIDRQVGGKRSQKIDEFLNVLDGIDTKKADIMTIFTTNYVGEIYEGMIRPGRIDVALEIGRPDADAAVRLVRAYLGVMFKEEDGDLDTLGEKLTGMIPAVIREVCERSKLAFIARSRKAPTEGTIVVGDVLKAAASMHNQIKLLESKRRQNTHLLRGEAVEAEIVNG